MVEVIEGGSTKKESIYPARPIQSVPRDNTLPLSFSQEQVWFIQQLNPKTLAYNSQAALRFTGPLNASLLERCLSEIVRRHEIYRTTFSAHVGGPTQVVHATQPLSLPVVDLEGLPDEKREAAAQQFIETEIRRPFDQSRLPLVRCFAPDTS